MVLLLVILVLLWNWEAPAEIVADNTGATDSGQLPTDENSEATDTPAVEAEPEVPKDPYEVTVDASVTGPVETVVGESTVYTYTFADGATMAISPSGETDLSADAVIEYTVDADGNVTVAGSTTSASCAKGSAGCTSGNGAIDLVVKAQTGTDATLTIRITDKNISSKTVESAVTSYSAIIETMRIN